MINVKKINMGTGLLVTVLTAYGFLAQGVYAKGYEDHKTQKEINTPHLSQDLKVILLQEMHKIEQGMMEIIPAISAGNWSKITEISQNIKKSFILKQKLTGEQLKKLHNSLPDDFIEKDQYFHKTAGKLANASTRHDAELVNFYFYKLHSQCVKCHSKYALGRFGNLRGLQE